MEQKEKKQKSDTDEKERLLRQLDDFGGLWHLDVVDTKISKLSIEKEKRLALKIQLAFWKKIIGINVPEHILQCPLVVLCNPYLNFLKTLSMS